MSKSTDTEPNKDHPEKHNPAVGLKCLRITKKDRPVVDPFTIGEAESLIAQLRSDWGDAIGNYDELRFFTGLRPSEQIALLVTDFDERKGRATRHQGAGTPARQRPD